MRYCRLCAYAGMVWAANTIVASAQQLNTQQIQIIKDTAASICDTVKEAKGRKSDVQIQGDVNAELGGLVGKVVNVGGSGKGSLSREEFEGLSRDATATALQGDRDCRERLFNKMFDKLGAVSEPAATNLAMPVPKAREVYPAAPGAHIDPDGRVVTRETYRQRPGWWSFEQLPFPCVDKNGHVVGVAGPAPGGMQGAC